MNPTFTLTIMAGFDGGRIVYETVHNDEYGTPDSRLVFGGDADQCSKYVAERIAKMDTDEPKELTRQIEPPVKVRVRKPKPVDALDALDALEMVEGESD